MSKVYIQLLKEIGHLQEKEIKKASINKNGSYVVTDKGDSYYLNKESNSFTILSEGHTSIEELDEYFSSPLGKKLPIRQGIEEDRKNLKYSLTLKQLKDLIETSYTNGDLEKIDWKEFVFAAINIDPYLYKIENNNGEDPNDLFFGKESHIVYIFLDDLFFLDVNNIYSIHEFMVELNNAYSSLNKKPDERQFSLSMLNAISSSRRVKDLFQNPSNEDSYFLIKKILETMSEKYFNIDALDETANNHYLGNAFEAPDLDSAEKELDILLNNGEESAAKLLGYLSLNKNNGQGDLDSALLFFLVSGCFNCKESKMKVGDILSNSESTYYSPALASKLYKTLYPDAYTSFLDGDDYDSLYPELAYRAANTYLDEKYGEINKEAALCFLLFASFAIKRRITNCGTLFLDEPLANEIGDKLDTYAEEEIKPTYKIKNIQECFYSFGQIKFRYKFSIISSIEQEDDGFIKMTIMTFNENNFTSYEDGTIFYCLPRIKRAVMDTKFVFRFKADSSFDLKYHNKVVNSVELSPTNNEDEFVLWINVGYSKQRKAYLVKDAEIVVPDYILNEKKVRIASVNSNIPNVSNITDYICLDENIKPNDMVYLTSKSKTPVKVISIREVYPSSLPLPIGTYGKIFKKKD